MWLPKDERRLLAGYYKVIGEIGNVGVYRESDLIPLLAFRQHRESVRTYAESTSESDNSVSMKNMTAFKREVKLLLAGTARVKQANTMLTARNMVTIRKHDHEQDVVLITLTVEGFDLGRRYGSWFNSTGLYFAHYKDHWFWLIVAAVGGGITSKLIDYFAAIITATHRP